MPKDTRIYRTDNAPITPEQGDLLFDPSNNTLRVFNGSAWVQARFTSITLTDAASEIVPGATSFAIRNNADSADNLLISDAGRVTVRQDLVMATAASQLVPGATSFAVRNNADDANNLIITDAGAATFIAGIIAVEITPTAGFASTNSATPGWYIPGGAGVPTGAVASLAGRVPVYYDTTNSRLCIRFGGSWFATASLAIL